MQNILAKHVVRVRLFSTYLSAWYKKMFAQSPKVVGENWTWFSDDFRRQQSQSSSANRPVSAVDATIGVILKVTIVTMSLFKILMVKSNS